MPSQSGPLPQPKATSKNSKPSKILPSASPPVAHSPQKIDLLHPETLTLLVERHNTLLSTQALIQLHNPIHPNHHHLTNTTLTNPKRQMKHTIITKHKADITPPPPGPSLDATSLQNTLKSTHTHIVTKTRNSLCVNPVLATPPPPISASEKFLPRRHRTLLAQLRCNSCPRLNQYQNFIQPATPNTCPACSLSPHDTQHIFSCPAIPTPLTPLDLWADPGAVITFLDRGPGMVLLLP